MSAESDRVEAIKDATTELYEAAESVSCAFAENELNRYTDWLNKQGLLKIRTPLDFSSEIYVDRFISETWVVDDDDDS